MINKWISDSVNARVVTENDDLVFYTDDLYCDDSVVNEVIRLHNDNIDNLEELGSNGIIDAYLLDEVKCTQEDRELIVESIWDYYTNIESKK